MRPSGSDRVLMTIENGAYPSDSRVRHEATALADAGYQVSVICQRGPDQPWVEDIDGISVFRYPAPPEAPSFLGYFLEYTYSLVATFLMSLVVWVRHGFGLIHAANPPDTAVFIALFYKLFGKKFIYDHHDLAPEAYLYRFSREGNKVVYRMLIWLEKMSCRFADHVIATNESYKVIEMERGNVPEERITIVRNGPELDRVRLVQPDPELRKRGAVIFGYIGAMNPQDGLDYLLRALHQLISVLGRRDFFCVLIGRGSVLADLKAQARELGLDPYVWFTGRIPDADVMRYLSTIDIGVDPDPSNIFNDRCTMIKMMEYMGLSKPIVAFNLPEHRVTAGEAALYARPNDELDFARKLAVLMDDPRRRQKMGQIGRQRIEESLAWPFQAQRLLEAYETVSTDLKGE